MRKTIVFNTNGVKKEFELESSLATILDYQKEFGTDLIQDIEEVSKMQTFGNTQMLLTITRIFYILHKPLMKEEMSYDRFLQELDISDFLNVDNLNQLIDAVTVLFKGAKTPNTR